MPIVIKHKNLTALKAEYGDINIDEYHKTFHKIVHELIYYFLLLEVYFKRVIEQIKKKLYHKIRHKKEIRNGIMEMALTWVEGKQKVISRSIKHIMNDYLQENHNNSFANQLGMGVLKML